MKKIIGILIAVMMVVTLAATFVSAEQEISVKLDDVKIDFADVKPQIINGRTMVPLRAIFEALGATVEWDDATKTVKSEKGDIYVALTIGEIELRKNWQTIELDVPAQIIDSRTMVPVRAISEAFECEVNWDDATKTVLITSPKEEEKNEVIKTEVLRWDFDNDGDLAGFSGGNVTLEAKNGFLNFSNPTTPDITANRYGMSLDASICDEVRIGIKGVSEAMGKDGAFFQMFFTTDTNPSMSEERAFKEKYADYKYTDGEVFELVINLKANKFWADTVKMLRIDPYNSQNETSIDYIVFYTVEETAESQDSTNKVDVLRWDFNDGDLAGFSGGNATLEAKNGFMTFSNPTTPDITANKYGMSLDASICDEVRIGIKGVSEAMGKDGAFFQMFFTTDTNPSMSEERSFKEKYSNYKYTDGEVFELVIDLKANKFWTDTVKMLRIDPYNAQNETAIDYIVFSTVEKTAGSQKNSNKADILRWDFNNGDLAGFSGGNVTLEAKDGFLNFSNPTSPDITANRYGMSLNAAECTELCIGIKGVSEAMAKDGAFFQMFFTTDANPSMSEERSYKEKYAKYRFTDGEVFEIVIDLTANKFWSDTVKMIRIDPYNAQNETAIDYIAFRG